MTLGFDFDAAVQAPFRMQPGLRRLADGAPQLHPLPPGSRHQREKMAVLSVHPERALVCAPGFDPAPAWAALARHAAAEHPAAFTFDGLRATALQLQVAVEGERVIELGSGAFGLGDEIARCLRGVPGRARQVALLALAFAEDFAVVDGETAAIPAIAACLPSHWAPQDKVGRHFAEVHAPVADNALLVRAGEHLMRVVCGAERWERFVWNVTRHPRLNAHPLAVDPAPWAAEAFADADAPRAWFRSERQTFIPVAGRTQALFTIGVDNVPLAHAIDTPAKAARLHDAIDSMSDAVLAYRSLADVRAPLLAWLSSRR
jgi:dimethylamine monooxygenase subunit A